MANIFAELEDEIFFNEGILFDESKIRDFILNFITDKLNEKTEKDRYFYFEEVMYNFFEYINVHLLRTKKTRDLGLDGVIKLELELLGDIDLGIQIKYSTLDSTDIDTFKTALDRAEIRLGVIVCKDSRKLKNYELNSKIRSILLTRGIKLRERIIEQNVDINPIFILKLNDVVEIIASKMRGIISAIYKR